MAKVKTQSAIGNRQSAIGHVRDAEGIGKAWGIAFYDQNTKRKIRMEQLAAIKAVMERADFPKPVKSRGYPRGAVVQYGMEHIKFDAKARGFEWVEKIQDDAGKHRTSNIEHRTSKDELPEQDSPAGDAESSIVVSLAEREAILSQFPADYQMRYRGLYEKWKNPNSAVDKALTSKEYDELVDIGLVKKPVAGGRNGSASSKAPPIEIPDYCSQAKFAEIVSELYNSIVYPQLISNAINKEGMPGRQRNQSIKTSIALPWWEKNKVVKDQQGSLFQESKEAEMRTKLHEERLAKIKADEAERSLSEKWMQSNLVEGFIKGFGEWLAFQQDKFIEDRNGVRRFVASIVTELFSPTPEQLVILDTRLTKDLAAANDAMKLATSHQADDLLSQLIKERAEQIQTAQSA